ncbi:MAG: hypothetical protein HY302_10770 [Opitutae bacterium]|nr:hypothetical protein [Opitutae bacterium]
MRTSNRSSPRKPAAKKKSVTTARPKWQFAVDAIGMVSGPRDLSMRKGLSA